MYVLPGQFANIRGRSLALPSMVFLIFRARIRNIRGWCGSNRSAVRGLGQGSARSLPVCIHESCRWANDTVHRDAGYPVVYKWILASIVTISIVSDPCSSMRPHEKSLSEPVRSAGICVMLKSTRISLARQAFHPAHTGLQSNRDWLPRALPASEGVRATCRTLFVQRT
jgi:hypothetical protein